MYLEEMMDLLNDVKKAYGNIKVLGYDYSAFNGQLLDGKITNITVLFDDKTSQDYVEIGFMTTQNALQSEEG